MSLNNNQFKLFYSAGELKRAIDYSADERLGEDLPQMWRRKLKESRATYGHGAVYGLIESQGFRQEEPLELTHDVVIGDPESVETRIRDGHHRVAAAAALERSRGGAKKSPIWINVANRVFDDRPTWMR